MAPKVATRSLFSSGSPVMLYEIGPEGFEASNGEMDVRKSKGKVYPSGWRITHSIGQAHNPLRATLVPRRLSIKAMKMGFKIRLLMAEWKIK